MNTMNDNIEEKCYLQYILSKYISNPFSDSQVQKLKTQYNALTRFHETPSIVGTVTEQW